jgi:GNAT superfamily N-acetyltransferase
MEWLLGAVCVALAITLFFTRKRLKNTLYQNSNLANYAQQTRAADNALTIAILAREVANELMQRDAEKYKEKFERLYDKWGELKAGTKNHKNAQIETISSKYKSFLDFDELGTKPHALYADGFNWKGDEDLWELYEGIRLYDALSCELDEEWRLHGTGIHKKELEHLYEYCKKFSDTKLIAHLYKAREQLELLRRFNVEEKNEGEWRYETKDYKYKRVADVAEVRWGVYVKNMDRYGMWGWLEDDKRKKKYTSFYAADKDFNEDYLDCLQIRLCVDARAYSVVENLDL